MKTKIIKKISRGILLLIVCAACPTLAAVIDLREQVREHPALIHHYTFHNDVLRDSKGDLHLEAVNRNPQPVSYGAGADALSWAGTAFENTNNTSQGSAWYTTNSIVLPRTLTVECVLRLDKVPAQNGYVVGAHDSMAYDQRAYFLMIGSTGYFQMRVGGPSAVQFFDKLEANHWYYVVTTFAVDSNNWTTVNAYVADLTAGGSLTHAVADSLIKDYYTPNSTKVGVGAMYNLTSLQFVSPVTLDEVALYDAVLDVESVTKHWDALRRSVPELIYREIFPSDGYLSLDSIPLSDAGWSCHYGFSATPSVRPIIPGATTAFNENLAPIASFPAYTGITNGYLNNYGVPNSTNCIYWTEEMTNQVEFAWLRAVAFDTKFVTAQSGHVAVRLDINATPQNTDDDIWYVAWDFANPAGTSALEIEARSDWWRYLLDMTTAEWTILNFQPDVVLELGTEQVYPPERAVITGFGLFHPIHFYSKNERIDNYTLYMRQIFPPLGTLLQIN